MNYTLLEWKVCNMYENKTGKDITILELPHFYLANEKKQENKIEDIQYLCYGLYQLYHFEFFCSEFNCHNLSSVLFAQFSYIHYTTYVSSTTKYQRLIRTTTKSEKKKHFFSSAEYSF